MAAIGASSTVSASSTLLRPVLHLESGPSDSLSCIVIEEWDVGGLSAAREIIREMGDVIFSHGVDMDEFQGFKAELDALPGKYAADVGGLLVLCVKADCIQASSLSKDQVIGCLAYRKVDDTTAELKRMYVRPSEFRGRGVGKALSAVVARAAGEAGYSRLVLDTLKRLPHAVRLYESLGFKTTKAYVFNPMEDVLYFEATVEDVLSAAGMLPATGPVGI